MISLIVLCIHHDEAKNEDFMSITKQDPFGPQNSRSYMYEYPIAERMQKYHTVKRLALAWTWRETRVQVPKFGPPSKCGTDLYNDPGHRLKSMDLLYIENTVVRELHTVHANAALGC